MDVLVVGHPHGAVLTSMVLIKLEITDPETWGKCIDSWVRDA